MGCCWNIYTSYKPSLRSVPQVMDQVFSPSIYAQTQSARAINCRGKKQGSVTYSTDQEDEVSKIFTINISVVCLTGLGTISIQ